MTKTMKVMQNWSTLNAGLRKLSLAEVQEAIAAEAHGAARQTILARLVARYGRLAAQDMAKKVAKMVAGR